MTSLRLVILIFVETLRSGPFVGSKLRLDPLYNLGMIAYDVCDRSEIVKAVIELSNPRSLNLVKIFPELDWGAVFC